MFPEGPKQQDWKSKVKEKVKEARYGKSIKELRDYTHTEVELYRRLPGGILSQCINEKEGTRPMELHKKISLYRRMQSMWYYWPNMNRNAAIVQEECQKSRLSVDKKESYVVFVTED